MTQQRAGTGQAKYKTIAADLRARIEGGEYPVGSRLPTHEALMTSYGAALNTVRDALGELREAGLVETHQGVGTVVIEAPAQEPAPQFKMVMEQIAAMGEEVRRLIGRMDALERLASNGREGQ